MKNKKGISAIVATVLIILITVAAVTIIWAAIIPMIQDQIGGSTECFDASAAVLVSTDFSCVNGSANISNVQVHRGTGNFELVGVEVVLGAGGNTWSMKYNDTEIPGVNGDKVYKVNYTGNLTEDPTQAGVAAIVKAGNTDKVCDKSGMVEIPKCN